jgi:hypothetical protein
MQVWGNLSNYLTYRDDNPTRRPVHHWRLGFSSHGTGQGVHVWLQETILVSTNI